MHSDHRAALVAFRARVARHHTRFIVLLAFAPVVLVMSVALMVAFARPRVPIGVVVVVALIGVVLWTHPFPTPLTVAWLGVRRAVRIVRGSSIVLWIAAVLISIFLL